MDNSRKAILGMLVILSAILFMICCRMPRIPQPLSYHDFADKNSFLGIPNFGDVASNLFFAVIGIWGLVFSLRSWFNRDARHFVDGREIWPYAAAFAGLSLTAFGSTYYHLAPDNARLVWDRLPIMITLMSLVAAVIAERIHLRAGLWMLPILVCVGAGSVLQWYWSETRGAGDLRFYAAVQAYSVLAILLALFFPSSFTRGSDFGLALGFYALAKVLEVFDRPIFTALHGVSGHTLKHIAAAAAGYCILRMLQKRRPIRNHSSRLRLGLEPAMRE